MRASDVAKYLLAKSSDVGDPITNKKLQKLLYYVKAWGLVYFTDGVIEDDFVAWIHGPVCVSVYHEYKEFGCQFITIDFDGVSASEYVKNFKIRCKETSEYEWEKTEMIDAVFNKYGVLNSLQLELLTHAELPWKEARGDLAPTDRCDTVISEQTMKSFYGKGNSK